MLNCLWNGRRSDYSIGLYVKAILFLLSLVENGYLKSIFEGNWGRLDEWAALRSDRIALMLRKTFSDGENRVDNNCVNAFGHLAL